MSSYGALSREITPANPIGMKESSNRKRTRSGLGGNHRHLNSISSELFEIQSQRDNEEEELNKEYVLEDKLLGQV